MPANTLPALPLLPLAVAACLMMQLQAPVWDVDIFWQLKLGDLTLAHGLPPNEPFLAGRDAEPLAVVAWLGQVVYAAVRQIVGWPGLRAFDALVWTGGFWVVAAQCAKGYRSALPAVIGFGVAWVAAVPFASVRPQSFAVLAFGLVVVLVRSGRPAKAIVPAGFVLLVLWQNLHPSAGVAVGYLAARAAGEWLPHWIRQTPRPSFAAFLLIPLAGAATLATPAGFDIYTVAAANRDRCVWDGLMVTEWFPLWTFFPEGGRLQAVVCIAVTLIAVAATRRKQSLADVMPLLALTAVTVLTHRFVLFWGVAAVPVWAAALYGVPVVPPRRNRWLGPAIIAAAVAVPAIALGDHFSSNQPVAAVRHLNSLNLAGPVYCPYLFGGVVTDLGYPNLRPTHDGRYYLFSREQLAAHHAARRGQVPVAALDREFHPVAFLVPPDDGLVVVLDRDDSGWVRAFADGAAVAFVPRTR